MSTASHTIGPLINPTVNRDAMRASAAGGTTWIELVNNQTQRVRPDLSLDIYLPETILSGFHVAFQLDNRDSFHLLVFLKYTQVPSSRCFASNRQCRSTQAVY